MERYGINGVAASWFKSYLSDRQQRVCVDGKNSDLHRVVVGVPQGSILGPTLFLLYINDLPTCLCDAQVTLYADDINIFLSADTSNHLLARTSAAFDELQRWMSSNRLLINASKTKCLVFSGMGITDIPCGDATVVVSRSCRLLGVVIDDSLGWAGHVDELTKKLSKTCYALYQLKKSCGAAPVQ